MAILNAIPFTVALIRNRRVAVREAIVVGPVSRRNRNSLIDSAGLGKGC
jgi:hypothetical protein